jgi:general secretion pathway protein J
MKLERVMGIRSRVSDAAPCTDRAALIAHRSSPCTQFKHDGFTLIELLAALLILALLALMSYRALGTVLDTREHVGHETDKWRRVENFLARFEQDVQLAAPRPVRGATGTAPAWLGRAVASAEPGLEFSRFAAEEGVDTARRLAYRLNEHQEIELWLWPGLDAAPNLPPARYRVLGGVTAFELQYLNIALAWVADWPATVDPPLPRAVQVRIVLESGEEIVRVFALQT